MPATEERLEEQLARSFARMHRALATTGGRSAPERATKARPAAIALEAIAAAQLGLAVVFGLHWLILPALVAAVAGGFLFAAPPRRKRAAFSGPPHIGMGASVAADAVVEPGARVEMGASVGPRAVVRSGAVVRMGASVHADVRVEIGAVVSWGADVHRGAVVEERARVGAGSDVKAGARVPAGTWLRPGSSFGGGGHPQEQSPALAAPERDPREARVAAVCDKLEAELRSAPAAAREFLGASADVIASLRGTCESLARRERELRAEASDTAVQRLDEERAALERRIAGQTDAQIAASLRGALTAIDEQKRQRGLLRLAADRLDAEHTRLLYTLEGLASQFVRMRTAGAQDHAGLEAPIAQLRQELDAIADALEDATRASPAIAEHATGPASAAERGAPDQTRTRA